MGMMDDMKDKMSDWSDDMKNRFHELREKEDSGTLDDSARSELQDMRDKMNMGK